MPRFASELEKHPLFKQRAQVEAPVSVGLKNLMVEHGARLEIMTNATNQQFIRAVCIGGIYTNIYGSRHVHNRVEQVERLAVSINAMARLQSINMVEAGGNLPAEYYNPVGGNRRWVPVGVAQGGGEDGQEE